MFFHGNSAYAWEFNFLGSAGETYDDNIYSSENNTEYDLITGLMVGFGINHERKIQTLKMMARSIQQLFYHNKSQNNNSQDLIFNYIRQQTANNVIQIAETFKHYPESRDFEYAFGRAEGRYGYYNNNLTFTYIKQFIKSFRMSIYYNNIYTKNNTSVIINSYSNSGGIAAHYLFNWANILSIKYDHNVVEYETDLKIREQRGSLQYQYFFTKQFSFKGNFGDKMVKSSEEDDFTNYIFHSVAIVDDVDRNNTISLLYSKDYTLSPHADETFNNWRISFNFKRQLSGRSILNIIVFYGKGEYIRSETKAQLTGISTNYRYAFTEEVTGSLNYNYTRSKTDFLYQEATQYDRNSISASLIAQF